MLVYELEENEGNSEAVQGSYDACRVDCLDNGWVIAAFARGIPEARFSGAGAELAVEIAVDYCISNLPYHNSVLVMEAIITLAFDRAWQEISKLAKMKGCQVEDYDTMLSMVVHRDCLSLYGCAGDKGIIFVKQEGFIQVPTMKSGEGRHLSLQAGWDTWKIEKASNVDGIIIASDSENINYYCQHLYERKREIGSRKYLQKSIGASYMKKWKGNRMAVLLMY